MKRRSPAVLPWLAGLLAVYLIAPFVAGLAHLGSADWRGADWATLSDACAVSLASATLATALIGLGGVPLGYLLARRSGFAIELLGFVVQLPLALPPLASGILLLFLLGYASPLGQLTGGRLTDSFAGVVLAEAFVAAPFLIIAARSAFAGLDPALEDVAASLGHRPSAVFLRITLPLAARAILAGVLLAWLRAFGEFGATVMVAYHPYTLPVYTYVAFGSQGLPGMLPVLLPTLVAAIVVMAAATRRTPVPASSQATVAQRDATSFVDLTPRPAGGARALHFAHRRALPGFTLDVAWSTSARRLAILGASGSGKSLTVRAIAGLDGGKASLTLAGVDLSREPPERRCVAYVPQGLALFPHVSVAGQLGFAVGATPQAAEVWLHRLGLSGLGGRLPEALSLGQQQRVALGRALGRPALLLLLDEPFSALDAPLRSRLRRELRAVQEQIEATTIVVTHDPDEAFLLADELLVLHNGRVLQSGPVETVFVRPASEVVARLLGADNVARGRVVDGNTIAIGGGLRIDVAGPPLPVGAAVGWSIRPDSLRLVATGGCHAAIIGIAPPVAGRREVSLRLGDATLRATVEAECPTRAGPCRVALPSASLQVWRLPTPLDGASRAADS